MVRLKGHWILNTVFGSAPGTAAGRGGSLILGYQKSAPTPTGYCARTCVRLRSVLRQLGSEIGFLPPVSPPSLAQWVPWVADDFWYSSMRKPPKASAARIRVATRHSANCAFKSHRLARFTFDDKQALAPKFRLLETQNHLLFTHSMRRQA